MLMPSLLNDRMFDGFFEDFAIPARNLVKFPAANTNTLKTDVKETENAYELMMDLPGFDRENINAKLKDGYLTVSANNANESEEKDENGHYIRRERYVGSVSRSFYVGKEVTEADISAKFENGVLNISVPKKDALPQHEEKFIAIQG